MAHPVLGSVCRIRQAACSAVPQPSPNPTAVPALLNGHASPDTAHTHRHMLQSSHHEQQSAAGVCTGRNVQLKHQHQQESDHDGPPLQAEVTFSHAPAIAALPMNSNVQCLRCGARRSTEGTDCRFHPALLKDPGPFLYSPEWHACRAAKHSGSSPGCYVRREHYLPEHHLLKTGLFGGHDCLYGLQVDTKSVCSPRGGMQQPQPRTQLPFPLQRPS